MLDLAILFATLPTPNGGGGSQFTARSIPGFEQHRLAKGNDGAPSLLISVSDTALVYSGIPVSLKHLTIRHSVECIITREDGTQETGRFSVICCVGTDPILHSYFLRVLGSVLTLIGTTPSQTNVSTAITKLIELFRVMSEPVRKSVQGLWAELLLIAQATDPEVVLNAWHATPIDVYDFNAGNQRLEVKSVSGRERYHHFSLAQLQPPQNTIVLIASMFMERSSAGVSLLSLVEEIRSRIVNQPELILRLEQIVITTLGESWQQGLQVRFDRELAESSLRFFDARVVPKIDPQLPPGVSDVRFKSDLTGVQSLSRKQLKSLTGLLKAAIPNTEL